jgi:hypothetical protein
MAWPIMSGKSYLDETFKVNENCGVGGISEGLLA